MSLLNDDRATDPAQQISCIANTAHGIEGRLLHLIKEIADGTVSLEDFFGELSCLVRELGQCFRRAVEMQDRRDLGFEALRELHLVELHGIWLYRKIHLERVFFRKLSSERKLRGMISTNASEVYQELTDAEEQEREFLRKGDAEIKRELLEANCSALVDRTNQNGQ